MTVTHQDCLMKKLGAAEIWRLLVTIQFRTRPSLEHLAFTFPQFSKSNFRIIILNFYAIMYENNERLTWEIDIYLVDRLLLW